MGILSYDKTKSETYALLGGINTKASLYVNDQQEFRNLVNVNFTTPGALTKRQGSTSYVGATIVGRITGGYEFQRLNGASYLVATANTNAYTLTSSFNPIRTGLKDSAIFDFVTFVDRLFAANGTDIFKFDGQTAVSFGLPAGISTNFGVTATVGGTLPAGTYLATYGYINDIGYYGPGAPGITIVLNGITTGTITYYGMTAPAGYGITAIQLYRTNANSLDMAGTTQTVANGTSFADLGLQTTSLLNNFNLFFTTAPKYLEIYNNQLFMAGFSNTLSTVYWSDIGIPESFDPTYNIEVRTNDGDRITGLRSYNGGLIIAKERSFHRLVGDDPQNFLLQEISDQYGCVSNRTMITWEDQIWFLDTKGIVQFNGANIEIKSTKIEPIMSSMNVAAARENACAIHNRKANELWFAIPTDGATMNNTIVVYDYVVQAWTTYKGLDVSSLWVAQQTLPDRSPFYGGYTGSVFNFGASLMGDNGAGITCLVDTKFYAVAGQSKERQYRRFYLDVDPVLGVTSPIGVEFRTNYGTTAMFSATMYQNPFQSRIDFGLSSRSIQAEITHYSATLPFKMNGFTFESRFQRNV